jgi:hypothetical protein
MSDAETLLHDLRAAVAALPVQTRIAIDEAETVHYVTVTREVRSRPMSRPALRAAFWEACEAIAVAHGCTFTREPDGAAVIRKPVREPRA